ncbi:MAG: glycosyltransferase [Bacillota bacterium]|nr:glycosyltransferase [Bacillota bacterium]
MVIVLVLDQFDKENNGLTVSAARFAEQLRARGHEARIVSTGNPAPYKYVMRTKIFPIVDPLISAQGTVFGRVEPEALREALTGADIVHMYLPYVLSIDTMKMAREMGVACFGAFHTQPENIMYNCGMKHVRPLSPWLYRWMNRRFYRYLDDIHCPTEFIAGQLHAHGYKQRLYVISNGVGETFQPMDVEKPLEWKDKFVIMMVGRLSAEKRQDLIIRAVIRSKYSDSIQLIFPGKGPKQKMYERIGSKLKNKPIFGYYKKEELARLMNQCDLYVHASEVEIEAISCIEAFACGLVPVISDSRLSATKQFALDERSLFRNKDYKDLTKKIEYWIEHPEEKAELSKKYLESVKQYSVKISVEKMERIYRDVIARQRQRAYSLELSRESEEEEETALAEQNV